MAITQPAAFGTLSAHQPEFRGKWVFWKWTFWKVGIVTSDGKAVLHQATPVEPYPPAPRWVGVKSSTRVKLACTTGTITNWANRSMGCRV